MRQVCASKVNDLFWSIFIHTQYILCRYYILFNFLLGKLKSRELKIKSNGIDEVDNPVAHQSGLKYQAATKSGRNYNNLEFVKNENSMVRVTKELQELTRNDVGLRFAPDLVSKGAESQLEFSAGNGKIFKSETNEPKWSEVLEYALFGRLCHRQS